MTQRDRKNEPSTTNPARSARSSSLLWLNLALRAVMETGIVVGLAYWGYQTGSGTAVKIGLAVAAPVLVFGFWGAVDFRQVGQAAEGLRLVQELLVTGLVALALWTAGQHVLGVGMAAVSIGYHVLVYANGQRLLKSRPPRT